MTSRSTTIRVSVAQRSRLRDLAASRRSTMTETFDAALTALARDEFAREMAEAESQLRRDPERWASYVADRDAWLDADLS